MTRSRVHMALVAAILLLACPAPAAATDTLEAQAVRLVAVDHHEFLRVKAIGGGPFDWSSDGCSSTPPAWAVTFGGPCQQHDFSYRNLGHGLRLRPTAAARAWADRRLLTEMRRVCTERFTALVATRCRTRARAMYTAVRLFGPPW